MHDARRSRHVLLGLIALLATRARAEEYPTLDHVQGTLVQTAAAPVRPVLIDSGFEVWAVNTGLGTVERFKAVNSGTFVPAPIEVRKVPWGPVSIAEWQPASGGAELLIVCFNTAGLLRMDKETGTFEEWIALPAEPADIVVDQAEARAFVSCRAVDAVVEIDLNVRNGKFHRYYDEQTTGGALRLKSPYFLNLESNGNVRVAPLHSGNNSTVIGQAFGSIDRVIDLGAPAIADPDGVRDLQLPDEDLFEIDPDAALASSVTVVDNGLGTILFAHGRNPANGDYWVLNTEAKNDDPASQSEPGLGFDFVENRATVVGASSTTTVGFDPNGTTYTNANAIGQPFALAFPTPTGTYAGRVLVTGLLTDNVSLFEANGTRIAVKDLGDGAIPRGIALAPNDLRYVAVLCWGTATIRVFQLDHPQADFVDVGTYTFRNDPLTQEHKDGRRIFFDGHRSAQGNVSCASCHVDGGTDFQAWTLSGLPFDNKGPMVTQTLIGVERVGPFHWRGERSFEDFNAFAFPGLLGFPSLSAGDFAKMKSWLFALKNPANPFQNRTRDLTTTAPVAVDGDNPAGWFKAPTQKRVFTSDLTELQSENSTHPIFGTGFPVVATATNAVDGLDDWQNVIAFEGRWTCEQCHSFPLGTNSDITDDELQNGILVGDTAFGGLVLPERLHFKNAPFHEIWRKKQSTVAVLTRVDGRHLGTDPDFRAFLGAGVQHAGSVSDHLRFAQFGSGSAQPFTQNVAALMQEWDQGLAPAAHYALWLNASLSNGTITAELATYLLGEASDSANSNGIPNCDIAILQNGNGVRKAWFLDRSLAASTILRAHVVFRDDHVGAGTVDNRSLDWFVDQAKPKIWQPGQPPPPSFLVLGLPVGMAERFAVDYDMDGIKNQDEVGAEYDTFLPPGDTTPPSSATATLGWVTTGTARLYVETPEPTTIVVEYNEPGGAVQSVASTQLSRTHSVILANLRPSKSGPVGSNGDDPGAPDPETVTYDWVVEASDASGNVAAFPTTGGLVTQPFSTPQEEDAGASPVEQLRNEHALASPPVVEVVSQATGPRQVNVTLSARLKQGDPLDRAIDRIFVVRAFRVRNGGAPEVLSVNVGTGADIGGLVGTVAGTGIAGIVDLTTGPSLGVASLPNDAMLVLNTARSTAVADVTLSFLVDRTIVALDDEVVVQVEAIVETSANPTFSNCGAISCGLANLVPRFGSGLSQWDFPRSKEVNMQGRDLVD